MISYRLIQAIILMPSYMAKQERLNHELLVSKVSEVFEADDKKAASADASNTDEQPPQEDQQQTELATDRPAPLAEKKKK